MASVAPDIPSLARDRSFELLYRRYVADVYHYALALLHNPADAEDVTQTTFLNAYRAYRRGEEIRKPQNWLVTIAHNVARSQYARASRRVREVPLDDHIEQLAVPEEEKPNVHAILEALGRLPLNQRAALVLRELEGRTYAEIADTLGLSLSAVETLIFRARRSLRLKASAVRVLGVVPMPSSLAQLFDAGGVAAGGGIAVGSGFLLKLAVAVVAGVVSVGVGDEARRAHAARTDARAHASQPGAMQLPARSVSRAVHLRVGRSARSALRVGVAHISPRRGDDLAGHGHVAVTGSSEDSGSAASTAGASAPAETTTSAATAVVGSVSSTAQSALPVVAVPSIPPPVEVPPLPSLP